MGGTVVLVAYGGEGPEREVSLASGKAVLDALGGTEWTVRGCKLRKAADLIAAVEQVRREGARPVVFVALHGSWGENGRLQSMLELLEVPYTGSGPESCMVAMDKSLSKLRFRAQGLPTPEWVEGSAADEARFLGVASELLDVFGTVVVKPCSCGSTVGITIVERRDELEHAAARAFRHDDAILAERYIPGRELTVTVLEDLRGGLEALPVVEIVPDELNGLYSYQAKYSRGCCSYVVPAALGEEAADAVRRHALGAHIALGCRGYSRVDLRFSGEGAPALLEVNTVPGMTGTSLVPKAAKAAGYSFADLLGHLVQRASDSGTAFAAGSPSSWRGYRGS
ncbi:MAG: D-alanine--D-alanine ligase [Synergistales bacterium]|nr:D-alanine--D-alanine ligase [Synergistales bacterium]